MGSPLVSPPVAKAAAMFCPNCGGPVELRASWDKDGILTVETRPDKGPKRTESYLVSNDGKHLYVTLVVERNGHEMKIRRAYDSAPEDKAPTSEGGDDDDRELVV